MDTEKVLEYATDLRADVLSSDPQAIDWRTHLRALTQSGVFTTPQAASILNINKQYAQRYLVQVQGKVKERGKRSRSGVPGNFDPDSLDDFIVLRHLWEGHEKGAHATDTEREVIERLLKAGNGVRLINFLTGVPVGILYRVRKEMLERSEVDG